LKSAPRSPYTHLYVQRTTRMTLVLRRIKGNVNRNGERIYHLQNQQFYARIKMDIGGGKRWFCTPEEAEAAGWRRALR
jgi:hypothetical protein